MMTEEKKDMDDVSVWMKCADFLFTYSSNMVTINGDTIIVAPAVSPSVGEADGLYTYDTKKNDWELFTKYPEDLVSSSHCLAYNETKNELYVYGFHARIAKFDINTKTCKLCKETKTFGSYPSGLFINDKYHIIGGSYSNSHSIYNETENIFESFHEFPTFQDQQIIHSIKRGIVYLFAKGVNKHDIFGIWEYKIREKEWRKTETKLPKQLSEFGCVITNDERFILIFGGYDENDIDDSDEIFIMNLDTMEIKKSDVKCPMGGRFRAAYCYDRGEKMDILIAGYVGKYGVDGYIPKEIMKMMEMFCCQDYVHLVEKDSSKHWRINVDEILM